MDGSSSCCWGCSYVGVMRPPKAGPPALESAGHGTQEKFVTNLKLSERNIKVIRRRGAGGVCPHPHVRH